MRILFIHQNCPGQFKHLAPRLAADPANEVVFLTRPGKPSLPNVRKVEYRPARKPSPKTHRYLRLTEEGILNGQAVARTAQKMSRAGFRPDIIVAHMGWGEALYLKAIWPDTPILGYFEWYYHPFGSDVDFDPKRPPNLDDVCRIESRNMLHLLNLQVADHGISPTRWQWSQHPREYRPRITVLHDGVDVGRAHPRPDLRSGLVEGLELRAGEEIVTYVARNLEPYRGFPTFIKAAEQILRRRPGTRILVVGGDGTSYGRKRSDGKSYREYYLEKLDLDLERIHFLGQVPYDTYLQVLQLSAAHIYLTVPFVLSWSMLEAMAAGCLIVGSRTPPVEEVIRDGRNGLLVDFFSPQEVADRVDEALDNPERMEPIRRAARQTVVSHYALDKCLAKQIGLIQRLVRKRHGGGSRGKKASRGRVVHQAVR
ncbi:MAG TPA: glycosyltransferase [Sedimenticola thiotaurini]|uniref:Glycosyltransferase n=1 Tax=Sedimenticola thiotaurini TaxID=1543721 RepID=A0A831RLZ5_9GAMM|nr:glycosyltransferase [Sedimenticola thiotaurini]